MSSLRTCTIERHFIEQQEKHPEATGELTRLMHQLAFAAKQITKEVRSAGLSDILGAIAAIAAVATVLAVRARRQRP